MSSSPADVVIVGSGVAGLCAAIEASERGASVLVLEAAPTIGGASVMSGAGCCLVGTPLQASLGIADSVELAHADWLAFGGPTADAMWARSYLENSRTEVYDWCESLGVEWVSVTLQEGNSLARWHLPSGNGRAIVSALLDRCAELGVVIELDRSVIDLETVDGEVKGVVVRHGDDRRIVSTAAVVVCSGGFVANHAMVLDRAAQLRTLDRLLSGGAPSALGSGHALLDDVGAQFVNLDHIWVYPNATPDPQDPSGLRGVGIRGVIGDIWLNRKGRRFHNESLRGGYSGTLALLAQPGQTAWMVFNAAEMSAILLIDNEYYATPAGPHPEAMAEFWRTSSYVRRADTARGLADVIGLPADAVEDSIAAFNASIDGGLETDEQFGRDLSGVAALRGPGLVAVQLFPMAQKNFGGVRTDLECRVLTQDGVPIRGLYAAGEVAGMAGGGINGRAALEGTMFGPSLYSGRIAGATAGAELHASVQ